MSEKEKRGIAIIGSTGSIGTQALDVIREHSDKFTVEVLTAGNNAELLLDQALEFNPNVVVIGNEGKADFLKDQLFDRGIKVYSGSESLEQVVQMGTIDVVLTAVVGYAGLKPTLRAIDSGKHIALANKETLVVGGHLVTRAAKASGVNLYPVDSEHSAIFQCLAGEWDNPIEKIYLTASGGPFRGWSENELAGVKKEQALQHPNWDMGAKITIDSASLMNKGLEAIEAKWLFALAPEQIDIIVHPESIIHSIVQFEDGSMKAQMGLPDMKLPIQYALGYPTRLSSSAPRFDFNNYSRLNFETPNVAVFRNLTLALRSMNEGGNMPCILNAANEIAVEAFLQDRIGFLQMSDLIESAMQSVSYVREPEFDDLEQTDAETRVKSRELLNKQWNS